MKLVAEATNITSDQTGSRLRQVIARAAEARARAPDQLVSRKGDPDRLLVSLLREVDETVLPRMITLENDKGARARLAVSNRRLCAVEIPGHPDAGGSVPNDKVAQVFVARLRGFLDGCEQIKMSRKRSIGAEGEDGASCSALKLARSGGIPLSQLGYAAGLNGFLQAVAPTARTWLYLPARGKEPQQGGATEFLPVLSAFHEEARALRKGQIADARPHCTVLDLNDALILVRAQAGGDALLALAPASAKLAIMSAWQKRI
ncbi:MAG: hypothetical protein AB3N11_05000 [Arenibacterium sp.]